MITEFDDDNMFAQMLVSKDKTIAKVVAMKYRTIGNYKVHRLKLFGLDTDKVYRIVETNVVESGSMLVNRGLLLTVSLGDYTTHTFHLVASQLS